MAEENIGSYKVAINCGFKEEGRKEFSMIGDEGEKINTIIVGKILE